jgi:hypothetical protein
LRRQLTAYVCGDDFDRLKEEAQDAGLSLSRYIQERLVHSNGRTTANVSESKLAEFQKKIIDANRTQVAQAIRPIARQLTMLLTMFDQFALSMLTHLPEIPESLREQALVSGERRHRGWRLEVEDTIEQMGSSKPPARNTSAEIAKPPDDQISDQVTTETAGETHELG